jgi:pimeloyl-ACP methyl ester carboxylesterase
VAGGWAVGLYHRPPPPGGAAAALDLIDARASFIEHGGRQIATWRWGGDEAPAVILAHGWGGHAAQMRAFVFPLLKAGFRVITYDQPAHGVSEGKLTGLPDFAEVLAEVAWHYGGAHAFVGHSLGAAAGALALANGKARFERAVLIGPPADLVGYSRRFARWYWMPEAVRGAMQHAIEERYGILWQDLEVARLAPRLSAPALVIHDRDDRHVPWTQGARIAQLWPGARLMSTDGLGHRRILEDEAVTCAAADFIAGRSAITCVAAPAVPHPAPVY